MIKLLSPKSILEYAAEEYRAYVRSLYFKKAPKKSAPKPKKIKPPFVWKLTKKGKISVKVNRTDPWLSRDEITLIAKESKIPENEVFLYILKRKIRISTQENEDNINGELPW